MEYDKKKPKTKKITFRVDKNAYDFLQDFCELTGMEISDLLRKIIFTFFMEYFMNSKANISERYKEARRKFHELFTDEFIDKLSK